MNCHFDKGLLLEFAVGEATADERREVELHLAQCALCRGEVGGHRQLSRELAALSEPAFPMELEEILVRASIQAARSSSVASVPVQETSWIRPRWVLATGAAAGVGFLVILVLLLWPGRFSGLGPAERVVGGGVGQGLGLLDSLLRWSSDLQAAWRIAVDFLSRFAPIGNALRVAFAGINSSIWAALLLGGIAGTLLLWRVTSVGRKKMMRRMGHAKPNS